MKRVMFISLCAAAMLFGAMKPLNGSAAVNQQKKEVPAAKATKVIYTCVMHPEVVSDKPGKCPKCHMNLVKKEVPVKAETKKTSGQKGAAVVYTCPMHPDVVSDKPGKCPKCHMNLEKKS